MSVWSDMSTIVTATLSGDINFQVVKAYRSDAAWFVFGAVTLIGAVVFTSESASQKGWKLVWGDPQRPLHTRSSQSA